MVVSPFLLKLQSHIVKVNCINSQYFFFSCFFVRLAEKMFAIGHSVGRGNNCRKNMHFNVPVEIHHKGIHTECSPWIISGEYTCYMLNVPIGLQINGIGATKSRARKGQNWVTFLFDNPLTHQPALLADAVGILVSSHIAHSPFHSSLAKNAAELKDAMPSFVVLFTSQCVQPCCCLHSQVILYIVTHMNTDNHLALCGDYFKIVRMLSLTYSLERKNYPSSSHLPIQELLV